MFRVIKETVHIDMINVPPFLCVGCFTCWMKPWYAMSSLSILTLESPDLRLMLKSPKTNVGSLMVLMIKVCLNFQTAIHWVCLAECITQSLVHI